MIFEKFENIERYDDSITDYYLENNTELVLASLMTKGILFSKNDNLTYYSRKNGYSDFALPLEEVKKYLLSLNFKERINKDTFFVFFNEDSFVSVCDNTDEKAKKQGRYSIYFNYYSSNEKTISTLDDFVKKNKLQKNKKIGEVYMISQMNTNLQVTRVGSDYHALEKENYSKESLNFHDKIIEEFSKEEPSGTIGILSGKPGTGKTYLIRSLIGELKKSLCIFVPPAFVSSLMGPQLVELLVRTKRDYGENYDNMCLILEDADEVLAPRMSDNISSISTLLNLSDGILGRILKIRIIATTNTSEKKFDQAIMRPGRLCLHEKMGKLSPEQCSLIYKKVTGVQKPFDKEYSLAEIYEISRTKDEMKLFKQDVKIGF